MKKYYAFICFLYAFIIIYLKLNNYLKNYLVYNMHIYLLSALFIIIIIGISFLISKVNVKFKVSDLLLLMPIIMLLFSGNGKLNLKLASNRQNNFLKNKKEEKIIVKEEIIEDIKKEYDFSKVDFNITDDLYDILGNMITFHEEPSKIINKTIRVKGFTMNHDLLTNGNYAIGKYSISCCAADASFVGFIFKSNEQIKDNTWYEIEGVLELGVDSEGYQIVIINAINIKEIDGNKEEIYVYPCYAYGDSTCSGLKDLNL